MKQKTFSLLAFIIFTNLSLSINAQDARLIAKNSFPSVVMLEMRDGKDKPISLGSGFFVRPDVVATNYHVIKGASDGLVKVVGKTSIYRIEGVVGFDKKKDLALLKLKGVIGKPLILADISKIEVGQEVFALGNPKGLEGTISQGIISGSNLRDVGDENLIQITAPISPGSSGGPVVNKKGEVIGVAVASLSGGQNLNFAVPSSDLALLLANLKSVSPLSQVTGENIKEKPVKKGPSITETTAWITEKLIGRSILVGENKNFKVTNAGIVFDNCTLTYTQSHKLGLIENLETSVIKFNKDFVPVLLEGGERLVLYDFNNTGDYPVRVDSYYDGKLENSIIERQSGDHFFAVGEKEIGVRLLDAFIQLLKSCKDETKKEPF